MSEDMDLATWRRQWRGGPEPAAEARNMDALRRKIVCDTRRIKLMLILPVLVTVGVGSLAVLRALRTGRTVDAVLAVEAWAFIVVVWIGALWIARGTWRPLADTTAAFIDLSVRRCEANLRGASLAGYLYALQVLIVLLAKIVYASEADVVTVLTSPPVILFGWLGAPLFYAWIRAFRRRQRAELAHLREVREQLGET